LSQKQASSAFTPADKRPLHFSDKQDHRRRDLPAKPQQVEKMEIPFPRLMPTGEHRRIAADCPAEKGQTEQRALGDPPAARLCFFLIDRIRREGNCGKKNKHAAIDPFYHKISPFLIVKLRLFFIVKISPFLIVKLPLFLIVEIFLFIVKIPLFNPAEKAPFSS